MFKTIIILLSFTVNLLAHTEGSEHLHLLGFLHSFEFGVLVVIILGVYALYRFIEREKV